MIEHGVAYYNKVNYADEIEECGGKPTYAFTLMHRTKEPLSVLGNLLEGHGEKLELVVLWQMQVNPFSKMSPRCLDPQPGLEDSEKNFALRVRARTTHRDSWTTLQKGKVSSWHSAGLCLRQE